MGWFLTFFNLIVFDISMIFYVETDTLFGSYVYVTKFYFVPFEHKL